MLKSAWRMTFFRPEPEVREEDYSDLNEYRE